MVANNAKTVTIPTRALPIFTSLIIGLALFITCFILLAPANSAVAGQAGCPSFPISATNETELNEAIICFNALSATGTYFINLTTSISLTTSTVQIDNTLPNIDLVIDGGAHSVDGQGFSGVRPFSIAADTTVLMQAITITNGRGNQGGAIYNEGDLDLIDASLRDNTAETDGGAIYNAVGGTIDIQDTAFIGNSAANDGGAIWGGGGLIFVRDSLFQQNTAGESGGAIWAEANMNYLGRSLFISNTAEIGGAIVSETTLSMGGVTLSGNTAVQYGGGMSVRSLLTLINSTISGNTAGFGGGISVVDNGVLNLNHVTLSGNTAVTATGGISLTTGSTAYVLNTIVANSTGADCAGPGSFNDSRYNLFEDGTCISDPTSITGDPNLAPMADNSGPPGVLNQLPTHALLPGSPALNAIPNGQNNCGSTAEDQRGISRPQGSSCDIGAFEAAILSLDVTVIGSGSVTGTGINCPADCSESLYESTPITLTAVSAEGFIFEGWSGDCDGTAVCLLLMNSPKSVTATFNEAEYSSFLSAVFSGN